MWRKMLVLHLCHNALQTVWEGNMCPEIRLQRWYQSHRYHGPPYWWIWSLRYRKERISEGITFYFYFCTVSEVLLKGKFTQKLKFCHYFLYFNKQTCKKSFCWETQTGFSMQWKHIVFRHCYVTKCTLVVWIVFQVFWSHMLAFCERTKNNESI